MFIRCSKNQCETKNVDYEMNILRFQLINVYCVLHNYARSRQHVRGDLMMQEVNVN
jgi:hypothetical protein